MNGVDEAAFDAFFRYWHPRILRMGLTEGAARPDSEDVAGAVAAQVLRSWSHWTAVEHQGAYLRKAVVNELGRTARKQAARGLAETRWAQDAIRDRPRDSVADTYEHAAEFPGVLQCLTTLPERRRQVVAWLYLARTTGWRPADIARELGLRPATIRCQRRHARRDLTPFLFGADHESRRWLRHGQRVHETFGDGIGGRALPRPVIADGWTRLRAGGLAPDRGTLVEVVDPDELRRRRLPARAGWPVIAGLIDLAARNDLLAVVVDADEVVLHRGGHRDAMAAADRIGFVDGARWDLAHAGLTAVGLARALGAPATVNRWEHYFPDQHGLCCVAIPVPIGGRHVTLNLTATADSLTAVPRALHRVLHAFALRLRDQVGSVRHRPPGAAG